MMVRCLGYHRLNIYAVGQYPQVVKLVCIGSNVADAISQAVP